MKTRSLIRPIVAALALLAFACGAQASTFVISEDELNPDVFPEVADFIRTNLEGPNVPKALTDAEKRIVMRSLDTLERLIAEDPVRNRARIRTAQARVNATLAPAVAGTDDGKSDVVCRRVKRTGSSIPTTQCRPRDALARDKRNADQFLDDLGRARALQLDPTRGM
ncbi:hypothetical protein [Pseudofulvimonas gallinarii]|jgi:hypothetical protein|uniref:Uncharacterized protein n=1 Tax=Pseudofulvimonas gallinarii TaxID=634155 RepID=A0A4S3KZS2_9GAMM|nr:hypothetical protein [Pseudofulvimonas gallinarii]TCT01151.1 hypothetical protein EDC25_1015 [Pseudofulvimonas gallinarii]THD14922.1 hypothetical protein B1808_00500 [Pseudofulvimonas gallinarii]